ncbi:protein odr-4 homolog [Anopheles cruzii]|uniref:protein odr-4 homolog n=1 Tax=Anopheles cruzii TaxID=68878 RepID=UPI0022EC6EF3|nr:protein odr-4 homolog [Anopheles cruzii]
MGRSVLCEGLVEEQLRYLRKHAGPCVGFLIGQPVANGNYYVVHANQLKSERAPNGDAKELLDQDVRQISQHALVETRMLPGGMYVLGIFVFHENNLFEDQALLQRVKLILLNMKASFEANPLLMGYWDEQDRDEKLVLYYSCRNKSYCCKTVSLDTDNPSVRPCDWKFSDQPSSWYQFKTYFETNDVCPLQQKVEKGQQYDTEANLTECAKMVNEQLEDAKILFDGLLRPESDSVEGTLRKMDRTTLDVQVYLPSPPDFQEGEAKIDQYNGMLKFDGIVSSQVYVHSQCTFRELERFIKADIVRSLMSRIQIHCDSLVQTDGGVQDKITLNELPRRIYFPIQQKYSNFPVQFSDYLFPDEAKERLVTQIDDILAVNLAPNLLNATVELVPAVKEDERHNAEECGAGALGEGDGDGDLKLNMPVISAIVAVFVLLIALLVYYMLK